MRLLNYTFIIGFLLFSIGCEKEETFIQIDLGEINLEESSKDMIPPSEEVKTLMFRDNTGDALRLIGGVVGETGNTINIGICNPESPNCEEAFRISYSTLLYGTSFIGNKRSEPKESVSISLSLEVELQQHTPNFLDDYPFFDILRINYTESPTLSSQLVVDNKGQTAVDVHEDYKRFKEEEEVTLLGEKFEHVIVFLNRDLNELIYYSKEKGIVGLVDGDDILWVLDN